MRACVEDVAFRVIAANQRPDHTTIARFRKNHELSTHHGRHAWLREAKRRLEEKRAEEARAIPRSRPERLTESKRRLEEERRVECEANAAYEAYRARGVMKDGRRFGGPPKPFEPPEKPPGKINTTDPDSRNVKTLGGYLQGYNAQAATNERQIVIAAEVTNTSSDFGQLEPIVSAAQSELERGGITTTPQVLVADAGYWHQAQMEQVVDRGIQVLVPPDVGNRKSPRPGWDGGLYAFMRRVLETDAGGELYRKRKAMIEPVFADTKFNRRIDRFLRRGRSAVRSEWRLITATHNLMKLHRHSISLAAA